MLRNEYLGDAMMPVKDEGTNHGCREKEGGNDLVSADAGGNDSIPFEAYKRRTTITIDRKTFLDVVCDALSQYKYVGPNQRADLVLSCRYSVLDFVNFGTCVQEAKMLKWSKKVMLR